MHAITTMRRSGMPVFYTIDAGPQVKAICPTDVAAEVDAGLSEVPDVLRTITGELGHGARVVAD